MLVAATVIVAVILVAMSICIVPTNYEYIIERYGVYHKTLSSGFHIKLPLIDEVRSKVFIQSRSMEIADLVAISKDNITVNATLSLVLKCMDSRAYTYGVSDPDDTLLYMVKYAFREAVNKATIEELHERSRDFASETLALVSDNIKEIGVVLSDLVVVDIILPQDIEEVIAKV